MIVERDMHWEPTPFSQINGVEHPAEARGPDPDQGGVVRPETQDGTFVEPDAEIIVRPGEKSGSRAPQMQCPECEKPAVNHPATEPVPWEAHGQDRPEWSHADRSALCPVIGTSGSYEPALPRARTTAPDPHIGHVDPSVATRAPRPSTPDPIAEHHIDTVLRNSDRELLGSFFADATYDQKVQGLILLVRASSRREGLSAVLRRLLVSRRPELEDAAMAAAVLARTGAENRRNTVVEVVAAMSREDREAIYNQLLEEPRLLL